MRTAPVTGHTSDRGDGWCSFIVFVILVKMEILFVDLPRHPEHIPRHFFLRFVITGKIKLAGRAVLGWRMAEPAFNAQGGLPAIHYLFQVIVADILRQYFEISLWLVILWPGSGHSDNHQCDQREHNGEFFVMERTELVMQHMELFWTPNLGKAVYISG